MVSAIQWPVIMSDSTSLSSHIKEEETEKEERLNGDHDSECSTEKRKLNFGYSAKHSFSIFSSLFLF